MKIRVTLLTDTEQKDVAEGMTAGDLVCTFRLEDDEIGVLVNGKEVFPEFVLSEGDRVFIGEDIVGHAPLLPGQNQKGVEFLRNFTRGAKELIIIDPYLLKPIWPYQEYLQTLNP